MALRIGRRTRVGLTLLLVFGVAEGGQVYRWTDANGVSHYGDRRPDAAQAALADAVEIRPLDASPGDNDTPEPSGPAQADGDPAALAQLRIEGRDGRYLAWADNRLAGPIEVRLRAGGERVASDPALPARATVREGGSALVAVIEGSAATELWLDATPGDPSAAPRDVDYRIPLRQARARVEQGAQGAFSHSDPENRHAVDLAAAPGTPVLAARAGRVMQVEARFGRAGLDPQRFGPRANFVRIVHEDGSMAVYAHLQAGGVLVTSGQEVASGQPIGLSGNTGFTTGPHLHFAVQVNRGMRLQSIPFRMSGLPRVAPSLPATAR